MSLYDRGEPESNNQFRDNTAKNAGKMENVSFLTFVCRDCKKVKAISGRKERGYKMGFRCASCAAEKEISASENAEKTNPAS